MSRPPRGRRAGTPAPLPGQWIVALPAWGERCVGVLCRSVLPALEVAFLAAGLPAQLLIWTDRLAEVRWATSHLHPSLVAKLHAVPGPDEAFESMSNCHRQAMQAALPGDRVMLLTADMAISRELASTCEQWFRAGRRIICCAAPRALEDGRPPAGATGRELLSWAWDNRHPMTRECTWPEGRSYDVWRMYFEREGEVAARVFLPHPVALVPHGRRLEFRPTIDVNLAMNFTQQETYMITSPDEGAAVELSPVDKEFLLTTTMRERMLNTQHSCPPLVRCTNRRHRMFFDKRVVIRGTGGDCGDGEVVGRVLG